MEMNYKPNVGWMFWFFPAVILMITPLMVAIAYANILKAVVTIPIILVMLAVVLIALMVVARTNYSLDDEKITVNGAFKTVEIPYGNVTKIVNIDTNAAPKAEFMLSHDRIGIFYGENQSIAISPRKKADALSDLRSCCRYAAYGEDLKPVPAEEGGDAVAEEETAVEPTDWDVYAKEDADVDVSIESSDDDSGDVYIGDAKDRID
jgi:hypothetical protein